MSPGTNLPPVDTAAIFAAMGDPTRLALIGKLSSGEPRSIVQLTSGSNLTRQAIAKHLRVLESAGLVQGARIGRDHRFALKREALDEARAYLDRVAEQWADALGRLQAFVESPSADHGYST